MKRLELMKELEQLVDTIDYVDADIPYILYLMLRAKLTEREVAPSINWNVAPEWAQWAAMDSNGRWHWFETQPILNQIDWNNSCGTRWDRMYMLPLGSFDWTKTLVSRPC